MGGEERKGGTVEEPLAVAEVGVDREWTETGMRPSRRSLNPNQVSWMKAEFEPKKGKLGGTRCRCTSFHRDSDLGKSDRMLGVYHSVCMQIDGHSARGLRCSEVQQ